jgi:hypothetical protein
MYVLGRTIIAGSTEDEHPEKASEQFWLELAENSKALDNFSSSSSSLIFLH